MARSAFLKYSLQVRIGNMDGIFVCFHNTSRIFGFQYISQDEMDQVLCGSQRVADDVFALSIKMLEFVLDLVTEKGNGCDFRLTLSWSKSKPVFFIFLFYFIYFLLLFYGRFLCTSLLSYLVICLLIIPRVPFSHGF